MSPLPNAGMDFTALDTLTAAELDDLVENIEALADGSGLNVGAVDTTALDNASVTPDKLDLDPQEASVATSQTTPSSSPADLGTAGPSVTITVGANGLALVIGKSSYSNSSAGSHGQLHVDIGGADYLVGGDRVPTANQAISIGGPRVILGLTPGPTTFKLQYSVTVGTGTFSDRLLQVIPL